MVETPLIETSRLRLVPFANQHMTERYVAWLNDPSIVRYSEQRHTHHTLQNCRCYCDELLANGHLFWAIELRDAPTLHIGNMTAYWDRPNEVIELSIIIGERDHHGRCYGAEAWCAVVDHLLNVDRVRRIEAGTMATNKAMLKVFEECGMREEGRRKARFLVDGEPVDLVQVSCFAAEGGG